MRVIVYVLWVLLLIEKKYYFYVGKFEFLVLKWVVIEYFCDYFYYFLKFIVFMDNNFLIYILILVKLNVIGLRWVNELVDFYFDIRY